MSVDTPNPTGGANHADRPAGDRPKPSVPPGGDVQSAVKRLEQPSRARDVAPRANTTQAERALNRNASGDARSRPPPPPAENAKNADPPRRQTSDTPASRVARADAMKFPDRTNTTDPQGNQRSGDRQPAKRGPDPNRIPETAPRRHHPFGGSHERELSGKTSDRLADGAPQINNYKNAFLGITPTAPLTQTAVDSSTGLSGNQPKTATGTDISGLFLGTVFAGTIVYKLVERAVNAIRGR